MAFETGEQLTERLIMATQHAAAATLAAAIISARGRAISPDKALEIHNDIRLSLFRPLSPSGHYEEWLKTKDARMKMIVE